MYIYIIYFGPCGGIYKGCPCLYLTCTLNVCTADTTVPFTGAPLAVSRGTAAPLAVSRGIAAP